MPGFDPVDLSGLRPGDRLTPAAARQAIRALWATGRVDDVLVLARPSRGGVEVRIAVQLNQFVRRLDIEGARALDRREIARGLGYVAGIELEPDQLESMEQSLLSLYGQRGYPDATVETRLEALPTDPEGVALLVTVEEGAPARLAEIDLRGELALDRRELLSVLELRAGSVYDQVALRERLERVLELYRSRGYYAATIADPRTEQAPRGLRLVLTLEAGVCYSIDYVGNRWVRDRDLAEVLALDQERELSRSVLDVLSQRLRDHYRSLGFYHARVDWRVFQRDARNRRLAFRIREGPRVRVERLVFEGNRHFTDRYLRRQVVGSLQEALPGRATFQAVSDDAVDDVGVSGDRQEPWRRRPRGHPALRLDPARTYVPAIYEEALDHIRALYGADGYVRAEVGEPRLRFSDRGRSLEIRIRIVEGPQTLVRSITFGGNAHIADPELERTIGLEVGEPLDQYEVEESRRRILTHYRERGYVYATVTTGQTVADEDLWADIRYDIEEGDEVHVGRILVRGNDATRVSLVRERLALREGGTYTPQDAYRSERSLLALGIFRSASVTLVDAEVPAAIKDVVVELVERPPQHVELRGGFSTADGPRVAFRYGYSNLGGVGLAASLQAQFSYQVFFLGTPAFEKYVEGLSARDRLARLVVLSLNLPHVPRIGEYLSMRFDVSHQLNLDPAYSVERTGGMISMSSGYRPHFAVQVQSGVEYADVRQVQDLPDCNEVEPPRPGDNCTYRTSRNISLARAPQGTTTFWVTRLLASVDFRNNAFNPSRGFFGSISAEHVVSLTPVQVEGLGDDTPVNDAFADSNLIRLTAQASGYIPLGWRELCLALSIRFGWVFQLTETSRTFPDRFFYLGGFDSMRGFPDESMRAQDVAEPGGNAMLSMRAELRIPLPRSFAIGIFLDTGNIWRSQLAILKEFTMRYALGGGLRYNTPVGPLALDGGILLDRREGEEIGAIHFSIGLF